MSTKQSAVEDKLIDYDSLVSYVHGLQLLGFSRQEIAKDLLSHGYGRSLVDCTVRGICEVSESPWPRFLFEIGEIILVCAVIAILALVF